MTSCPHQNPACETCINRVNDQRMRNDIPAESPPPVESMAGDLRAKARRLRQLSDQLAKEAADLHYAAERLERRELER